MAAKGLASSSSVRNREFLLEIEAKVRKCWENGKVFSTEFEKPGDKFFGKFTFDSFMGNSFSLSKLDRSANPPAFPVDVMRFALAYVCDGAVDEAKINFLLSNADSVFDNATTAILKFTEEISWHEELLAADFYSCLRCGPPSTTADKVFANEINLALNRTKQQYEAGQFRGALESIFELQDARDLYKSSCGGTNTMNRDLVWRFMDVQACLITPVCPHYAEYVWKELLYKIDFVVNADWPVADAPECPDDSTLHDPAKAGSPVKMSDAEASSPGNPASLFLTCPKNDCRSFGTSKSAPLMADLSGSAPKHMSTLTRFFSKLWNKQGEEKYLEQALTKHPEKPRTNPASMYCPPSKLLFQGTFDKALATACEQDKWLLVNMQCVDNFSSHMLNQHIWGTEAICEVINTNFIFWHEYFDTPEGSEVSRKYLLDSRTTVLLIDPMTGEAMCSWDGMVQRNDFMEDLLPYLESSPKNNCVPKEEKRLQQHTSMESMKLETSRGSTSEEDLVPFQNPIPRFTSPSIEDVSAAFMESVKLKKNSESSSKAKVD